MITEFHNLPALTTDQMNEVDRLMVEEWGINLIQMMENTGRNLAELARRQLGGTVKGSRIVVISGNGNSRACLCFAIPTPAMDPGLRFCTLRQLQRNITERYSLKSLH